MSLLPVPQLGRYEERSFVSKPNGLFFHFYLSESPVRKPPTKNGENISPPSTEPHVNEEVRVAPCGQLIVSVASQDVCFTCIICVPSCQLQAGRVASPVSIELYYLHRKLWVYKMSNNWTVLTQFYCNLKKNYMHTYRFVE